MSLVSPRKYRKYALVIFDKAHGYYMYLLGREYDKVPLVERRGRFRRKYKVVDMVRMGVDEETIFDTEVQLRMFMDMQGMSDVGIFSLDYGKLSSMVSNRPLDLFSDVNLNDLTRPEWPMGRYLDLDAIKVDENLAVQV